MTVSKKSPREVLVRGATIGKDVIEVLSTTSDRVYRVDVVNGRCSCPGWINQRGGARKPCRHLKALGFTDILPTTAGIRDRDLKK